MKKSVLVAGFLLAFECVALFGDEPPPSLVSLHLIPELSTPIGRDVGVYALGGGGVVSVRLALPSLPFLSLDAGGGFDVIPIDVASGKSVSSANLLVAWPWAGVGVDFKLIGGLHVGAHIDGGYFFGFLKADTPNSSGQNPMFSAGIDLTYYIIPALSIGAGASYRNFLGLYNGVAVRLGTAYHFQRAPTGGILPPRLKRYGNLSVEELTVDPVFPVLFKYYDDHPIGKIRLKNTGRIPLEDVKVSIFVKQYMDNPTVAATIPLVKGGESLELPLSALFNTAVLGISEPTKVQINVGIETSVAGETYGNEEVRTLRVYDRNSIVWSDDRRTAAFVTAKDATVQKLSKNVVSIVEGRIKGSFDANLLKAIALHEALSLYGVRYQIDPTTPYSEFSKKAEAIDYLQFPNQTLGFKAGDCDDLSILNCALLESLGIPTAFVTVPGHIFMAFALEGTATEALKRFSRPADLIVEKDLAWVPVEITSIDGGFLKAWDAGAREWRQYAPEGKTGFYPVREAWELYEPVQFDAPQATIEVPDQQQLLNAYMRSVNAFVDRELPLLIANLQDQLSTAPGDPNLRNRLGVVYARFARNDEAKEQFQRALARGDYAPALVNIGTLAFRDGDLVRAKSFFDRAYKIQPSSAINVLNLARVSYELKDADAARRLFGTLRKLDSGLAERFSYLDPNAQDTQQRAAAAAAMREVAVWAE